MSPLAQSAQSLKKKKKKTETKDDGYCSCATRHGRRAMFGASAVHPMPIVRARGRRRRVERGRLHVSGRRDVSAQQEIYSEEKVCSN